MGGKSSAPSHVLMLGLDNAGKTSILKRLCNGESIRHIQPTQGHEVKTLECGSTKMKVWDIGGQKTIRPYWQQYFANTHVLIYVVDSSDRRRLEESGLELMQLLDEDQLKGVPLLVFANKQDLVGAVPAPELVECLQLMNIKDRKWQIQPSSAKTGIGVQTGLQWAAKVVSETAAVSRSWW